MNITNLPMPNEELTKARRAVRKSMITFVAGAFGLVAALAWNEAIKDIIDTFVPEANGILAKIVYAVAITIFVALVLYALERPERQETEKSEKK